MDEEMIKMTWKVVLGEKLRAVSFYASARYSETMTGSRRPNNQSIIVEDIGLAQWPEATKKPYRVSIHSGPLVSSPIHLSPPHKKIKPLV